MCPANESAHFLKEVRLNVLSNIQGYTYDRVQLCIRPHSSDFLIHNDFIKSRGVDSAAGQV